MVLGFGGDGGGKSRRLLVTTSSGCKHHKKGEKKDVRMLRAALTALTPTTTTLLKVKLKTDFSVGLRRDVDNVFPFLFIKYPKHALENIPSLSYGYLASDEWVLAVKVAHGVPTCPPTTSRMVRQKV